MVPKGLGSVPEGSGMSRNHPGRSRNGREWTRRVLEGSGSFRKVPQGSGQYHMRPTTLSLGGQGTPRGLAEIWVVGAPHVGGVLLGLRVPGGKVSLWKEESQGDSTSPYCAPRASWPPI